MSHDHDYAVLAQRIALLERQSRRWRRAMICTLAILASAGVAAFLGAASFENDVNAAANCGRSP